MADSAVAVTAGSGTNIDTRTESTNSNHRQVIVIGDPATNAGVAPVDGTAGLKVDLGADNDVTVTNAGTFVVQIDGDALTALQLIDNAISGTEMQVDVVAALPAGTNAIGKLAPNSGVDIGDVDVTSTVQPAGFGTVGQGRKVVTTAGTAVQLDAQACSGVIITAESDNTNLVAIGASGVVAAAGTQEGFLLFPGQTSPMLPLTNTNLLYVDSITNGEGITYTYFS